ncbi:monocyte differentiation antigen CD14 [Nannospalax galili]|uniref:Monocyte differentiation antigen CD14 n=1 Tax=Nannospalax galili TaxID=1026970 RepID=A0A8C6WCM0_NANGA|nr:monocyte differentiation antigen CD14 [Nannospalax galili]
MECVLCLLLFLLTPVHISANMPEPCELEEDAVHCVCNFSDPKPNWSNALQCMSAVDVKFYGGGRSLELFLRRLDPSTDLKEYVDIVRSLRWQRLTVGGVRVPAPMLFGVLRMLGHSGLSELTLEDLEVTSTTLPPLLEATGPDLTTLRLRNVSWATGDAWLAELQQWLKPGLKVLNIAQAQSLNFSCERVRIFRALTTLDLSDNPGLGDSGLVSALCPQKFPALQVLALRNAGMETPSGVCNALAKAGVQPQVLDLSHNSLRNTVSPGAPGCVWPSSLNSLNLSFARLEQVPKGLPSKLSVLDLSCNRLNSKPRPDELPKVDNLSLKGNPFLDSGTQEYTRNSGMGPACARSSLAVGISGTLALLQRARRFI